MKVSQDRRTRKRKITKIAEYDSLSLTTRVENNIEDNHKKKNQ